MSWRDNPHNARSETLSGLLTVTAMTRSATPSCPAGCSVAVTVGCSVTVSAPLGPFTDTTRSFTDTSTPFGSGMGLDPIRDIGLGNFAKPFPAQFAAARFFICHQSRRRGDDRNADVRQWTRQLSGTAIHAAARSGDAAERANGRFFAIVFQSKGESFLWTICLFRDGREVAFALQDFCNRKFHPRGRGLQGIMTRGLRIADARQKVANRVGIHRKVTSLIW